MSIRYFKNLNHLAILNQVISDGLTLLTEVGVSVIYVLFVLEHFTTGLSSLLKLKRMSTFF